MKKLEPLFGYDVNYDAEGNIEVNDLPNYPQETKNAKIFYERLELIKIDESKISFPLRLNHWVVTINPNDKATIMNYFNIKGIKKVVEEHKSKLFESTTFVKAELQYPKKTKYPNLHIHFYQVVNEGGEEIIDEYDMIDFCQIIYENTKQFTKKRIDDLEKYVNTQELFQIPFLPLEMVRFDDEGNITDFQQHLLALSAVELPF